MIKGTDPVLTGTYLVAFRGEHLILEPSEIGELNLPWLQHDETVSDEWVKRRLMSLLGDRGTCVWMRYVGATAFVTPDMGLAHLVTCDFSGYFPPTWVSAKPNALPEAVSEHHLPLIDRAVKWRSEKELEQSRLGQLLKKVLDPDVRKGFQDK